MNTSARSITAEVRVAWWVRHYIAAIGMFAALHGAEPDLDKLARVVAWGIRVRLVAGG